MKNEYLNNKVLENNIACFKKAKKDKLKYELILEDLTRFVVARKPSNERTALLNLRKKEYQDIKNDFDKYQTVLASSFLLLAQNIIRYRKYNFVDVDDAIQEFVMICFDKLRYFDSKRGAGFSFFTTVIINCYRQMYRTAKNYNELKRKFSEHQEKSVKNTGKIRKNAKNYFELKDSE